MYFTGTFFALYRTMKSSDKIHFWQIWLHRIFDIMHLNWPFICQRWEWLSHLSTLSFLKHLPRLLFLFRNLFWNIWKHFWKHLGRVEQGMIIITDVIWQHRDPNINIKITLEIFSSVDSNFSSSLGMMEEAWCTNSKVRTYLFFCSDFDLPKWCKQHFQYIIVVGDTKNINLL